MLKSLGTEFKVGLFAVVALSTLAYMFFVLQPDFFENKEYAKYYTILDNAAGIVAKTHVKTAGVSIGKVRSVNLEGGQTHINIEVDKTVKIPVGSHVEIRSVGLLGDKHLEIIRPADNGQYIQEGGLIPQSVDNVDMERMISLIGDVAKDVKKVTATLANVFGTKKGEQSIQNIVDNIEAVTADLKATTGTVKDLVGAHKGDLSEIVLNVRDGVRDLRQVASNLKGVVSPENKERIDHILASFDATMTDVKGSAKNINLISEKVEKGEGTLGKLVNDDETITELQGAIKDIRKVLSPVNKLEIDVDMSEQLFRSQAQTYFNVLFKTRPDRFYLIGLTDGHSEVIDTTTTNTPNTTGGTSTHQTIHDTKEIRFQLQMAKRWYNFQARVGLFESTGGVATDLYLLDDIFKFSVEAFDFDLHDKTIRRNAHLKTYGSILFYKHIYGMAGIDDPSQTDPVTNKARPYYKDWFVGAGLTFTDDDLKAIFGAAAVAGTSTR